MDVQESLIRTDDVQKNLSMSSFLLERMLGAQSLEMKRKVLALASDMLEEFIFIQNQLQSPDISVSGELSEDAAHAVLKDALVQLRALKPLGAHFCTAEWGQASFGTLSTSVASLQEQAEKAHGLAAQSIQQPTLLRAIAENAVHVLNRLHSACPDVRLSAVENADGILQEAISWAQLAGDSAGDVETSSRALRDALKSH